MHLMIYFELNDLEIGKHNKCTEKSLKLGMVSSFDPHNMSAKVERVTTKIGCTSCTNWTISFKVRVFQTKTHLLQSHFIILSLFQLQTFCAFNMHHSKTHSKISTISNFIFYFFMHLMIYFERNDPEIGKPYNCTQKMLKLGMVSSFDPHNMSAKV